MSKRLRPMRLTLMLRLERICWLTVYYLFFRYTPNIAFNLRRLLLIIFGAKISSGARIYPSVKVWLPRNLLMDQNACLGPNVNCYNVDLIELGEKAIVSQDSVLCTASHNFNDPSFSLVTAPIKIGSGCWIGANSILLPGLHLDEGAVIGMGSVLTKSVPSNEVWAGNPAKKVSVRQ